MIRWDTFSIGADREVAFEHTRQQVVLNRVVGGSPSEIFGRLRADGHVFLINPQGVVIGGGAEVSVGSLVASTLDIEDEAFLDGRYAFAGDGGRVSHAGRIEAGAGGYVALLGGEVHSEGVIEAPLGSVALAAGDEVSLAITGDGRMQVQIERGRLGALVEQHGVIEADGGTIILTTEALGEALDSVVNQTGILRARTVEGRAGTIVLVADKESGTADVGGRLDAGAPEGGDGGFIETSGAWVRVREDAEVTTCGGPREDGEMVDRSPGF